MTFPVRWDIDDDERGTVLRGAVDDPREWPDLEDLYFLALWTPLVMRSPLCNHLMKPPETWHSYVVLPQ